MRITALTVERFRGIRHGTITFENTTVFVGENDCGRTALLQALALLLGWGAKADEFAFASHHFHVAAAGSAGAIRLNCRFEGCDLFATAGELEVRAESTRQGTIRTEFLVRALPGGKVTANDRQVLRAFRQQMPVFWLSAGLAGNLPQRQSLRQAKDELVEALETNYRRLLEGTAEPIREIEQGYHAAQALIASAAKRFRAGNQPLGAVLTEISGARGPQRGSARPTARQTPGSAAEKIGTLLLAGAIVSMRSAAVEENATPLVIIEDPEAHLHPMTLASVWNLIERIAAQKIICTHSGSLLAAAPLASLRRLTRQAGDVREWRVPPGTLSHDELRRYTYHVRSRRGVAHFARCWLLVEGETEYWLLGELARLCGYSFAAEGIVCVEFAQCGVAPILKVAQRFGIEWHLLADGDAAGMVYAEKARRFCRRGDFDRHVTLLQEHDIESCFWRHGYADVFRKLAFGEQAASRRVAARGVIRRAIEKESKPYVAVQLLEAIAQRGAAAAPAPLRGVVEHCIRLARQGSPAGLPAASR